MSIMMMNQDALVILSAFVLGYGIDALWARAVRGMAERALKFLQTGLTQSYLIVMLVGTLGLVAYVMRGLR